MCRSEHVLALKVTTGRNLVVPSGRTPNGFYVLVSTTVTYGQRKTAIKAAMVDCSVSWNETLIIGGRPLRFPRWFMPFFSSTSKAVSLEIYASFELNKDELVVLDFPNAVVPDGGPELLLPDGNNQRPSIGLKARREKRAEPSRPNASPSNHTRPRERNIVIFGETGSGKSSVFNAIAQRQLAKISNNAFGCTDVYQRHEVEISDQKFVLFDTVGLDEGTAGTIPAAEAEENLKRLTGWAHEPWIGWHQPFGIATSCGKNIPIVVVVTGLEKESVMKSWWDTHMMEFTSHGMRFDDHACVTTLPEDPDDPVFTHHIMESRKILRKLIVKNHSK
ncbi:hypothetical protein EDB19DRAFT_1913290 [Suillus lakei]|nr:hypothetical protein EDB19DRAFT_1913290 [Suillus lakei]